MKIWFKRFLGLGCFLLMTLAGITDAYRALIPRFYLNQMYSKEDLELANWVKENTSPRSVWLTGNFHNHWLFNLTGRQPLATYSGWLWTHGYNYHQIAQDVQTMYKNPGHKTLFTKYGVHYIVIGPFEKNKWKAQPKEFSSHFYKVMETPSHQIWATSKDIVQIKPVQIKGKVFPGLTEKVYQGKTFKGELLGSREGVMTLQFNYSSDEVKPFKAPFSIVWEGFIKVPEEGLYEFVLDSDDGSWLYIDDKQIIDNGGIHRIQRKTQKVNLKSGFHKIKILYFDDHGGAVFEFRWKPPKKRGHEAPSQVLFYKE